MSQTTHVQRLVVAALALILTACGAPAQADDEQGGDDTLVPARERFPLETELGKERWRLTLSYDRPEKIVVTRADGLSEVFWYQTFTVSNWCHTEAPLKLSFTVTTDVKEGVDPQPLVYRDGVYPEVEARIEKKLGLEFLNSVTELTGTLAPNQSRRGIALYGPITPRADRLQVDVAGLWQPTHYTPRRRLRETQVLRIVYSRSGDAYFVHQDTWTKESEEWVVVAYKELELGDLGSEPDSSDPEGVEEPR